MTVAATVIILVGHLFGLGGELSTLLAVGTSMCGVSAIIAGNDLHLRADAQTEVAVAIACGQAGTWTTTGRVRINHDAWQVFAGKRPWAVGVMTRVRLLVLVTSTALVLIAAMVSFVLLPSDPNHQTAEQVARQAGVPASVAPGPNS
jgi:hypothetical protein